VLGRVKIFSIGGETWQLGGSAWRLELSFGELEIMENQKCQAPYQKLPHVGELTLEKFSADREFG
jgi:hypothetical protein